MKIKINNNGDKKMNNIEENKMGLENEKYPGRFTVLECDRRKLFDSNGRLKSPGGIQ